MISDRVMEILAAHSEKVEMPEKTPSATPFSDHKGDSVTVRIFRYGNNNAEQAAEEWLREARESCYCASGSLVTAMATFRALGGEVSENNVIAMVGGYDIGTLDDMRVEDTEPFLASA